MKTKEEQLEILNSICPLQKGATSSKRELRQTFYSEIKTEIQAYLLGFHAADGSVDKKRKMIRIKLQEQDEEIINLYRDYISPNSRIFKSGNYESKTIIRENTIKTNNIIGIEINSATLVNDLVKLGFGFNKTYNENHIPKIPKNLIRHFIRGYFDSDGCITINIRKYILKSEKESYKVRPSFNIEFKTKTLAIEFKKWLKIHQIDSNVNFIKRDNTYRLNVCSEKSIKQIYNVFYNNSNFYLVRKFHKFNYYVNTEVSQIISDYRNA